MDLRTPNRTVGRRTRSGAACLLAVLAALLVSGCAGKARTLELTATILYEKPSISEITYTVADGRTVGGTTVVTVTLTGDPSLEATFDISPGVALRAPLREEEDGRYVGQFPFPRDTLGGPFTVVGRLEHDRAGSVTLRDPHPITISIVEPLSR